MLVTELYHKESRGWISDVKQLEFMVKAFFRMHKEKLQTFLSSNEIRLLDIAYYMNEGKIDFMYIIEADKKKYLVNSSFCIVSNGYNEIVQLFNKTPYIGGYLVYNNVKWENGVESTLYGMLNQAGQEIIGCCNFFIDTIDYQTVECYNEESYGDRACQLICDILMLRCRNFSRGMNVYTLDGELIFEDVEDLFEREHRTFKEMHAIFLDPGFYAKKTILEKFCVSYSWRYREYTLLGNNEKEFDCWQASNLFEIHEGDSYVDIVDCGVEEESEALSPFWDTLAFLVTPKKDFENSADFFSSLDEEESARLAHYVEKIVDLERPVFQSKITRIKKQEHVCDLHDRFVESSTYTEFLKRLSTERIYEYIDESEIGNGWIESLLRYVPHDGLDWIDIAEEYQREFPVHDITSLRGAISSMLKLAEECGRGSRQLQIGLL